jgi:hypothetical protein
MIGRLRSRSISRAFALSLLAALAASSAAGAQWSTTYEQFYMPGEFNWQFRENYPAADRLFNAFDYGHAILYERLWTRPNAPVSNLEEKEYAFITKELLVNPPRVPLEEAAIEVAYAKLVPEAKMMFDWAHLFHRQVYDVWADERIAVTEKDAKVAELLRYYKSRRDLAFSSLPKTMELMEAQPYSLAFRKQYPKFNGLIWAYHWLQVGLYEPLVVGKNKDERQTGILAAVARFRQMIENPPTNMPRIMPMTGAVAPTFAARYPEASIIFDNLHSMHDVVSDILANDNVPRGEKRARILEAARRYRENTSYVMTVEEWRSMARMMGIENMGGPAVGFLGEFPTPTVERGAVMAGMDHSKMPGMRKDSTAGVDHARMGHDSSRARAAARDTTASVDHSRMHAPGERRDSAATDSTPGGARAVEQMTDLYMRMLTDSVIRRRVLADTGMRRALTEIADVIPAEHREHFESMLRESPPTAAPAPAAARKSSMRPARAPAKSAAKPAPKPADPHAGHRMPPAKPPAKAPTTPQAKRDSTQGIDHSNMRRP